MTKLDANLRQAKLLSWFKKALLVFIIGVSLQASPALAQSPQAMPSPESAPMPTGMTEPQGSGSVTGMTVRTPEDIEKDRDIVPNGGNPVEVPNRATLPNDEYLRMKQGGADRTGAAPDRDDPQK